MQLLRWDTKELIFELECNSWEELLKGALKAKVSFRYANFSYANFSYANFSYANFSSAVSNMGNHHSMQLESYAIFYTNSLLVIGCEHHSIKEWEKFTDKEILEMDGKKALKFWRKWKEFIFKAIELTNSEEN